MDLLHAIEGFILSRLADGYAPVTLRGYKSSLNLLSEYLNNPDVNTISYEQLKEFMAYLHTSYKPERKSGSLEPLATASFHRYWKAIRSFFKWASEELNSSRPDLALRMPKWTSKEIIPLTDQEIVRLLKACENRSPVSDGKRRPYQTKRPTNLIYREKAIILFLLDTGVRSGECSRLLLRDVNMETGEVVVRPHHIRKTRPRTVFLGKASRRALWRYLTTREDPRPDDSLFVTMQGKPMTQENIKAALYAISQNAKVDNVHPHRFRHTFAIQYLRNGGDVFTLQRLLGHATLEMVRHYLALADSDTATAHRKASPVDRWNL